MFFFEPAFGSVLLDINGASLTGRNLRSDGMITDLFSITLPPPNQAPTITTPPTNLTVMEPNSATFRMVATNDGAQFDVVVSNAVGSVTSAAATLTVTPPSGGTPVVAWTAAAQNPSGSWKNSTWDNRSFRILLEGSVTVPPILRVSEPENLRIF